MAEFDPEEFLGIEVTRPRLARLDKLQLWKLMQYLELEAPEDEKKRALVQAVLVGCNTEERERQDRLEERDRERHHERVKLDLEKAKLAVDRRRQEQRETFDLSKCFSSVPKFEPDNCELFFEMFEKIALPRQWPKEEWVTLIQGSLTGKAQAAYVALDLSQLGDYDLVRQMVLKAYELVPEAYRQSFRTEKVKPGQTYLDFARQQEAMFDKWLRASDVYDFKQLRELMVLEKFEQSLPRVMHTHLNDLDVKAVFDATDNYALTHRDSWRDRPNGPTTGVREVEGNQGDGNSGGHRQSMNFQSGERQFRFSPTPGAIISHNCRRPGHLKSRCPALQRGEG